MSRPLVLALGLAALGVGVVGIAAPALLPVSASRAAAVFAGVVPLVLAYRAVMARYTRPRQRAPTGAPERPAVTAAPGGSLPETLREMLDSRYVSPRTGLRSFAVTVLERYAGYADGAAADAVDDGSWTDDPEAAAFVRGTRPEVPLLTRLRNRLHPESRYRRALRRTVDAIGAAAGEQSGAVPSVRAAWVERLRALRAGAPDEAGGRLDGRSAEWDTRWETGHLRGVGAVALAAAGVGVLAREPAVVVSGVVGVGAAAMARGAAPPEPSLSVQRRLETRDPAPGDSVRVTVTIHNTGERTLPDLRVVDGVPAALAVVEGTPRTGAVLRPGASTSFSYTVEARRGEHGFDPPLAIARDLTGRHETVRRPGVETVLECVPRLSPVRAPVPLREGLAATTGPVTSADAGDGVAFHATREYRRGDPLSRVDWNRRARTGDLATMEFREERAARVVLLLDARAPAYVTPGPGAPHAVERAVEAAGGMAARLLETGNRVGVAALAPADCWLAPAAGATHRAELRTTLANHPALGGAPPEEHVAPNRRVAWLRRRLSDGTQVVVCSPLADAAAGRVARQLGAYGYPVSVVSPDATARRTPEQRLAVLARRIWIADVRGAGVPVVDWGADEPLAVALTRASRRWPG